MAKVIDGLSPQEIAERASGASKRCICKIEGNPLDAEDIEMFEMFEREGGIMSAAAHISWRRRARSQ